MTDRFARRPFPVPALRLLAMLGLAACTPFPETGRNATPAGAAAPGLLPIDQLLAQAGTQVGAQADPAPGLSARAAALRARAAALRVPPPDGG